MGIGGAIVLGLLALIAIVLIVSYYQSTQVVGKYMVSASSLYPNGVAAEVRQATPTVAGTAPPPPVLYFESKVYTLVSWNGLGFNLLVNGQPTTATLSQNPFTGDLTLSNGSAETKLIKVPPATQTPSASSTTSTTTTSSSSAVDSAKSLFSPAPASGDYIGCFTDSEIRALPIALSNQSFESCKAAAKSQGAEYFGLQDAAADRGYGKAECWAGSGDRYKSQGPATSCAALPTRGINYVAGRGWSNAVYKV